MPGDIGGIETRLYGKPAEGGLTGRIEAIEKDLFGRPLPGAIAERQTAIIGFVEGTGSQDAMPMRAKIAACEWSIFQKSSFGTPGIERIGILEDSLYGERRDGALAMRLERIITDLFGGPVKTVTVQVRPEIRIGAVLIEPIVPALVKRGDPVLLRTTETLILDGVVIAPEGSAVYGEIESYSPPKRFGKSAEVALSLSGIEGFGWELVPVKFGGGALNNGDGKAMAAAGATSITGLALAGPLGLIGGILIRGDAKTLPAGTRVEIETVAPRKIEVEGLPGGTAPVAEARKPEIHGGFRPGGEVNER